MIFSEYSPQFSKEFFEIIKDSNNIMITSHINPDDDAIGSSLSLYYVLTNKYPDKKFRLLYSSPPNPRFSYFTTGLNLEFVEDIADHLQDFDTIIFTDSGQFDRFGNQPEKLQSFKGKTICIDHHAGLPSNFNLLLIDPNTTSATELVYLSFCQELTLIPKKLCETLLLGILGDTGNLKFVNPKKAGVFSAVQKLIIDGDIKVDEFESKYNTYSDRIFAIVKEFVKNTKVYEIPDWPKFTASYISRKFAKNGGYSFVEVSEASKNYGATYIRSLTGIPWGFSVRPFSKDQITVSARALPKSINVRILMESLGVGSGHDQAAGGTFTGKLNSLDCLNKILDWIKTHKPIYL